MSTKKKVWAVIFDESFTYYGGHLDKLAVFSSKEHAKAFAEMFMPNRKTNKYKVVECILSLPSSPKVKQTGKSKS